MAACGSFQHIFDTPLPEKTPSPSPSSSLLESLSSSWKPVVRPPIDHSSFTELFGELHFKENTFSGNLKDHSSYLVSGGAKLGESLQLCTEGLGSESSADVEDLNNNEKSSTNTTGWQHEEEEEEEEIEKRTTTTTTTRGSIVKESSALENQSGSVVEQRRSSRSTSDRGFAFPPPISCIGKTGKPWVCFKSYREDGRFVLKEVRIPTQEFLHACREDGRLKLQFVQPDNENIDEVGDEEEEDESFLGHDCGDENHDECMDFENAKQ